MSSSLLMPDPAGSDQAQRLDCARRLLVAENILETISADGSGPDTGSLAYLQAYINGEISLGQAVGSIVDHLAQEQVRAAPSRQLTQLA